MCYVVGGGARAREADKTPLLLLPMLWLSELARRFTLLEAWLISKLGVGSRRNLLLALLLFLLLAVPIYVLYAGKLLPMPLTLNCFSNIRTHLMNKLYKRLP